ncbi:molecular chaperone DnaJ [bacterium]|nr:molecular chaperone DnaJ [bacterium]
MAKRDCYELLGISKSASQDEIKKAYRKAAIKYHPDKNPGDKVAEEKFKEATDAYSILSNSENRRKYDQFGHAAFEQGAGGGFSGDFSGFEDLFGDIFSSFFGGDGGRGRGRGTPGRDLKYNLEVEFEDAVFGVEQEIEISRPEVCTTCEGNGAAPGTEKERCQQCQGQGQVAVQQGFFTIARTCPVCQGQGEIVRSPCHDCSGLGRKNTKAKLSVKVPAGIDHGQRLKMRGEGEPGIGGGADGDLYVQVVVKEHPIFERDEFELFCEIPITYSAAVLGTEIEIPTLEGKESLKVPAGTPSGKVFTLRSKGVPLLGSSQRGNLHVRLAVHVPKKLGDRQRELLEELRELEGDHPLQEEKGFFEKLKEKIL